MVNNVLDAIKEDRWFEPENVQPENYLATNALPGSTEKIGKLAERVEKGLPLWHPEDRTNCEDLVYDTRSVISQTLQKNSRRGRR